MGDLSQRVFLVTGPWHLVTLASSLETERRRDPGRPRSADHLVAWGGERQGALRASLVPVAKSLHSWASVTDVGAMLDVPSADHLEVLGERLRSLGIPRDVDELWIPAFWPHTTKVAAAVWGRAEIVLFEEGLLTYSLFRRFRMLPFLRSNLRRVLAGSSRGGGLRHLRDTLRRLGGDPRNLLWEEGAPRSLLRRTRRDYRVLRSIFGTQPDFPRWIERIDVPREVVLDQLDAYRRAVGCEFPPASRGRGRVLFLPQNLSSGGWMEEDVEVAIYVGAVGRLVAAGHEVLWKEHPRAVPSLYPRVAAAFPGRVAEVRVEPTMPVEAIAPDLGVDLCCGIYTMSLAYLPFLHGIGSACIASECLPHVRRHDELVRGLTLMARETPSLDEVLGDRPASRLAPLGRAHGGEGR